MARADTSSRKLRLKRSQRTVSTASSTRAIDLAEGDDLETVDITLRIGRDNLANLSAPGRIVECEGVWLTEQPDGTYALGILAAPYPGTPRRVENNDAGERLS